MSEKILVVDDEQTLAHLLELTLKKRGYQVITAQNGYQALQLAREQQPDLILLDIMMPGIDGLETCRRLRQESDTPVIMITARTDEIEEIIGLELGADDYIKKPYTTRVLIARIRAVLRRNASKRAEEPDANRCGSSHNSSNLVSRFEELTVDLNRHQVFLRDKPVHFRPKEFELLAYLVQHRERALTRREILQDVWGWENADDTRTLDVHIRWLREKIEADPTHPRYIITVRNVGYRFDG